MISRKITIVVLILVLFAGVAGALRWKQSYMDNSGTAFTGRCVLKTVAIMPDGTNDVVVNGYDNTAASGTLLFPPWTISGTGGMQMLPPMDVQVTTGIYLDYSGDGSDCNGMVYYEDN